MKKVLIIAPEYMGYIAKVAEELRKNQNLEITDIHIPTFKYPNLKIKIKNFFLKKISRDVKFDYRKKYINTIIGDQLYDCTLVIRPDLFTNTYLKELKIKSTIFKSYFFDGIERFPQKIKTIPLFDEIFSFEPNDCIKYKLKFITNFIYEQNTKPLLKYNKTYNVFNITSYDKKRYILLLKIGTNLKQRKISFKIIVKKKGGKKNKGLIDIITQPISLEIVHNYIQESLCMLDLGVIDKHKGLTFRIFEAMGLSKKIITNNPDITNYDFYNPQNILIINNENPIIPNHFLETEYIPVPKEIYNKYTLESWVKTVFKEII
jgi:hypothetical protein